MRRASIALLVLAGACRGAPAGDAGGLVVAVRAASSADGAVTATTPASTAAPLPVAESRPRAPLRARWVVEHESAGRAVLVARVERFTGMTLPIDVRIEVPDGVALASGDPARTIPPSEGPVVSEQRVTLQFQGTPAGDAVLEARTAGPGFGVTARDTYAFGRPKHERAWRHGDGRHVQVGGRDFGPSVRLGD